MTATLINGQEIATNLLKDVKLSAAHFFNTYGIAPGVAVLLVGDNPSSQAYVNIKLKRCSEIGIKGELIHLPLNIDESAVINIIQKLNQRSEIHGIIIQLPLPKHLSIQTLIQHVSPQKDLDGLHPLNIGALHSNQPGIIPCTPKGIVALLKTLPIKLEGKHALVIGRSMIVGKPIATLLLQENCTVTHVHSHSQNWENLSQCADIIVVAAGLPTLLRAHHIKKKAIIIDVGCTRIIHPDRSTIFMGDVDRDVFQKAAFITPVPGGVGPMTVAMLLQNTVEAAWDQQPSPN